ncbi:TetR/AcrR family transcriptional regulator [Streptomyces boninensis]|uniref:TetR/AcrR family transcriptional regulator n=1 Tax=Streptomyces boninensis TaxID=2039455 RepID=UPI003B22046B
MVDNATTVPPAAPRRRTQRERREATIGRLIDATIDAIAEVGYARASLGEICARSGVSRGGLFRHFDSRLDLLVAAAAEVGRRHIVRIREQFEELREPTVAEAFRLMRARHRATENVVWFELMVAARTDAELRTRLSATGRRFFDDIVQVARMVPGTELFSDAELRMLLNTAEHTFDGETIRREIDPDPAAEDERLQLICDFAEFYITRRLEA